MACLKPVASTYEHCILFLSGGESAEETARSRSHARTCGQGFPDPICQICCPVWLARNNGAKHSQLVSCLPVLYAIFLRYLLHSCFLISREPLPHCLHNVMLIPPYEKVVLEATFNKISSWAISLLRESVLHADDTFNRMAIMPQCSDPVAGKPGVSLGTLPCSRFLLAALGMLSAEHNANGVSLLLNSGVFALTQTVIRLAGPSNDYKDDDDTVVAPIVDESRTSKKPHFSQLSGPEMAKLMCVGCRVVRGQDWKWGDQVRK